MMIKQVLQILCSKRSREFPRGLLCLDVINVRVIEVNVVLIFVVAFECISFVHADYKQSNMQYQ